MIATDLDAPPAPEPGGVNWLAGAGKCNSSTTQPTHSCALAVRVSIRISAVPSEINGLSPWRWGFDPRFNLTVEVSRS